MILKAPAGEARLRVAAIGDVGAAGRARARARRDGYDSLFRAVAPALRAADLAFANLEFPIAEPSEVRAGRAPEFRHETAIAPALAAAGVRVVSLANNHMMDCGERGLTRTLAACASAGIQTVGAGATLERATEPARFTVRGRRVVVLAYAAAAGDQASAAGAGVAPLDSGQPERDLARWRPLAEDLIVSVHWGSMYVDYPPPRVLEIAARLESLGADLILGHHPHVTQGWRARGGTLTLFSLGDVVFDPAAGDFEARVAAETRRDTGVFTVTLAGEPGLALEPCVIDADGVPEAADSERATAAIARLQRLSAGLASGEDRFRNESAPALLRYEWQSLGAYLRAGRFDRALRLLMSVRPRHLPLIWGALVRGGRRT